jgi:putative transposase
MPSTFVRNPVHFVFGTKQRRPLIKLEFQEELWRYMAGVAKRREIHPIVIGGVEDHCHALLELPKTMTMSDAMRYVKGPSSKWFREAHVAEFGWQDGFAGFGVSHSLVPKTYSYIQNQREHHKKIDFRAEYLLLLKKHGIEYDERYVFD